MIFRRLNYPDLGHFWVNASLWNLFFVSDFFAFTFFPYFLFSPLFSSLLPKKWLAAREQCSRAPALSRTLTKHQGYGLRL